MNKQWTGVFDLVVKYLPALINIAEGLFAWKKKSGADKKDFVIGTLKTVTAGIAAESTGGQAATWEKIGPCVDMALEGLVGVAKESGAFVEPEDENAKISMG